MGKQRKFEFKSIHLTGVLILVLIILLVGAYLLTYPILIKTELYRSINDAYREKVWVTFKSERAKFSFKHPISWPVSKVDFEADNGRYKYHADDGIIEYVDFGEEFSSQAEGPSLGFIIVVKSDYTDLKGYIDELSKEQTVDMYMKGRTQKVTIKPPKIEYLKIGGVDAISVTDVNTLATFSRQISDFRLIRNGLLYRFVTIDSAEFLEDKDKNSKTFQQIIASVKFFN